MSPVGDDKATGTSEIKMCESQSSPSQTFENIPENPSNPVPFLVACPWDDKISPGLDVFENKDKLLAVVRNSRVQSWAPNCATFSAVRSIPIAGSDYSPKPFRSEAFPLGLESSKGYRHGRAGFTGMQSFDRSKRLLPAGIARKCAYLES